MLLRKKHKTKLLLIIVAIVSLTSYVTYYITASFNKCELPSKPADQIEEEDSSAETDNNTWNDPDRSKTTGKCTDFYGRTNGELSLYGLPDCVKENSTAVEFLESNCLMVYQIGHFDVTADGEKDLLLITEGISCITCRATKLIIISNNKVIYSENFYNAMIRPIKGKDNSFELKEPIFIMDEGYCCPKKGTVSVMEYRKFNEPPFNFVLVDQYIENYGTTPFPAFNERKDYYEGSDEIENDPIYVSPFGIVN